MRHSGAQARVHEYATRRPGLVLTVMDVAADMDLPRTTVSNAFGTLARVAGSGIQKAQGRGAYIYKGKGAPSERRKSITIGTLLECVGFTDNGDPVIRDEENVTYIARLTK